MEWGLAFCRRVQRVSRGGRKTGGLYPVVKSYIRSVSHLTVLVSRLSPASLVFFSLSPSSVNFLDPVSMACVPQYPAEAPLSKGFVTKSTRCIYYLYLYHESRHREAIRERRTLRKLHTSLFNEARRGFDHQRQSLHRSLLHASDFTLNSSSVATAYTCWWRAGRND